MEFNSLTHACPNIPPKLADNIENALYKNNLQNKFSEPMLWIGIYMALASLICTLAMMADLVHGVRNRKLWFPCKYFTLNAASLTVIAVAIKLPMDLTTPMVGTIDERAKLGSLTFMCTIMANKLPSLATMGRKELVSNMIALGLLVITLVGNVFIQIRTGVISNHTYDHFLAKCYAVVLLMYFIIYTSTCITIIRAKQILESKYQVAHMKVLNDHEMQQPGGTDVEMLKKKVSNYCIMAETGNPQFITTCLITTTASGVICAFCTSVHILGMIGLPEYQKDYSSDYKWSLLVLFIIQSVGVIIGTIAPLFRCFAPLTFKLSIKWIVNRIKVFKVESYWIQMLYDMKHSSIPLQSCSRKYKFVIQTLKILALNICIGSQKTVVVICKMVALIPIIFVIIFICCLRCWKWLLRKKHNAQVQKDKDISPYVLQLQDDLEFGERTLKGISKFVNRLFKKAEKKKPSNLMKLLAESRGFEGVEKVDSHHVPPLPSEEFLTCWSLTLVTLTTIAMSLPNIQKNIIDSLLSGVSEGLVYVTHVEECLNVTADHVSIEKAAKTLWLEVEVYRKWLGNKLPKVAPQENTVGRILLWFRDTAKNMVTEVNTTNIGVPDDSYSKCRSISANSMYRVTETILLSYHENIDQVTQEELFQQLSSMIADIFAACLTNLPQLIAVKCHTNAIEKREASVCGAAEILGETMQIIDILKQHEIPNLNPDELAYIDKWRNYYQDPCA